MNTEEKAEAYDKAIEGIQEILSSGQEFINMSRLKLRLQPFFPELKESWDERIRKAIINVFATHKDYEMFFGASVKDILAWLEKQGEQKPTDKVETKFHEGDWVVWDNKISCHIDNIYQGKESLMYTITDVHNMTRSYSVKGFDNNAHLWTIQDAKDGDVLACESGWTCIFKTLVNDENFSSYCFMDDTKWFCETGSECHTLKEEFVKAYNGKIYPATKEQRDTLMKAMADAGWKFDYEKKELKKIEQKPADKVETKFHEGDWVVVSTIKEDRVVQIASVEYLKDGCPSYITTDGRWFGNRTKARLLTNKDVEIITIPESRAIVNKIKSWSKEDEDYYDAIIAKLEVTQDDAALTDNQMKFLKSLKNRYTWKPSKGQMEALLSEVTAWKKGCPKQIVLESLYNDLKKL